MTQGATTQTEIKNCLRFFFPWFHWGSQGRKAVLMLRGSFLHSLFSYIISLPRVCWRFSNCLAFPHHCPDMPPHRCPGMPPPLREHRCFIVETHWAFRTLAGASPEARDPPRFNRNIHMLRAVLELKRLAELAPWPSSTLTINFLHGPMTSGFSSRWWGHPTVASPVCLPPLQIPMSPAQARSLRHTCTHSGPTFCHSPTSINFTMPQTASETLDDGTQKMRVLQRIGFYGVFNSFSRRKDWENQSHARLGRGCNLGSYIFNCI